MLKKINFLMTYTKIYVDILHECLNLLYSHFYSVFLLWICWGWVVGALSWFSVDEFKLHKSLWSEILTLFMSRRSKKTMYDIQLRVFLLSLFPHLLCNSKNIKINVDHSHLTFISSNCLQKIFEIILVVVDFMKAETYLIRCLNPAVRCWFVTTKLLLVAK